MGKNNIFVGLIVTALLVRLLFLSIFWVQQPVIVDELHYNAIATNLVEKGVFANHPDKPTAIRPPLFPFFIAAVYSLTGINDYNAVRVVQIFFGLFTGLLLYHLCKRLSGQEEAQIAVSIFLLYPSLVVYNYFILSETLFNFFFVASLFFIYLAIYKNKSSYFLGVGVCMGLASLTRSITYPMMPLLVVFFLIATPGALLVRLKNVGIMVVFFALVLSPWVLRNFTLFGQFVPIDTMGGLNLYMGNYEHTPLHRAWAAVEVTGEKAWHADGEEILMEMNEAEKQKWAIKQGLQFMLDHPLLTIKRSLIKAANFWGIERSIIAGASGQRPDTIRVLTPGAIKYPLGFLIVTAYASVMIMGFFGLIWENIYSPSRFNIAIAGIVIYFTLMHALVFGHSRYHLPLVQILAIYSAKGLSVLGCQWRGELRSKVLRLMAFVICTFLMVWFYEIGLVVSSSVVMPAHG